MFGLVSPARRGVWVVERSHQTLGVRVFYTHRTDLGDKR